MDGGTIFAKEACVTLSMIAMIERMRQKSQKEVKVERVNFFVNQTVRLSEVDCFPEEGLVKSFGKKVPIKKDVRIVQLFI